MNLRQMKWRRTRVLFPFLLSLNIPSRSHWVQPGLILSGAFIQCWSLLPTLSYLFPHSVCMFNPSPPPQSIYPPLTLSVPTSAKSVLLVAFLLLLLFYRMFTSTSTCTHHQQRSKTTLSNRNWRRHTPPGRIGCDNKVSQGKQFGISW